MNKTIITYIILCIIVLTLLGCTQQPKETHEEPAQPQTEQSEQQQSPVTDDIASTDVLDDAAQELDQT